MIGDPTIHSDRRRWRSAPVPKRRPGNSGRRVPIRSNSPRTPRIVVFNRSTYPWTFKPSGSRGSSQIGRELARNVKDTAPAAIDVVDLDAQAVQHFVVRENVGAAPRSADADRRRMLAQNQSRSPGFAQRHRRSDAEVAGPLRSRPAPACRLPASAVGGLASSSIDTLRHDRSLPTSLLRSRARKTMTLYISNATRGKWRRAIDWASLLTTAGGS